jgi:hypothetical protein
MTHSRTSGNPEISEGREAIVSHPARIDVLLPVLLVYCAASLLHHTHNAEFLGDYPNLPPSLTPGTVYLAWLAGAAVGALGYFLYRRGQRLAGLFLIGVYGVVGLYGLAHYVLAPLSAHTLAMNLTIWLEVIAAGVLLITVAREMRRRQAI